MHDFLFPVDIFCDVINGGFSVISKAGNGQEGQAGGNGAAGRNSGYTVRSMLTVFITM